MALCTPVRGLAACSLSDATMETVVTPSRESTNIELNSFEDFIIPKPTSGFSKWRDNSLNNFNNFADKNSETASNNSTNSVNLDWENTEFEFEDLIDNLAGVECAVLSGD